MKAHRKLGGRRSNDELFFNFGGLQGIRCYMPTFMLCVQKGRNNKHKGWWSMRLLLTDGMMMQQGERVRCCCHLSHTKSRCTQPAIQDGLRCYQHERGNALVISEYVPKVVCEVYNLKEVSQMLGISYTTMRRLLLVLRDRFSYFYESGLIRPYSGKIYVKEQDFAFLKQVLAKGYTKQYMRGGRVKNRENRTIIQPSPFPYSNRGEVVPRASPANREPIPKSDLETKEGE